MHAARVQAALQASMTRFAYLNYLEWLQEPPIRSSSVRQPRDRLARPYARRVIRLELFSDSVQNRMVVRRAITRHGAPVHRGWCVMRLPKPRDHVVVPALRIGVFLVHERDPAETSRQGSHEIGVWQIAFETDALLSVAVEEKHSRRPHRVESVEPSRMLLDMRFDRHEMLVDEVGRLLVAVRLGFQPSARASSRHRAEIEQDGAVLLLRGGERLIHVLAPIHQHESPPRTDCYGTHDC